MEGWPKVIILIDADAFFAAVEVRDHPEYRGKPVIVGARPGTRGVVSTCSYEARKYGVRSAMPISQAFRLCPQGIYVSPSMGKYQEASERMFAICENFTPMVEPVSIDEGYLDVTPSPGVEIARKIREEIRSSVGITVTAGVSYCRYLAKVAAEESKPDGLGVVPPEKALEFLKDLQVSKLPGVGPKTLRVLEAHGVHTAGDLRSMPPAWFESTLGKYGARLRDLAEGKDPTPVETARSVKSVSEETTFEVDQDDPDLLYAVLAGLSQDVGWRLRQHGLWARTIGIKVRFSDFSTLSRERTLPSHINADAEVFSCVKDLFDKLERPRPVRLLGVSASGLSDKAVAQPGLFDIDEKSWNEVSKAVDTLRKKYGKNLVNLGATLHSK
ncbi:MAG: DNA polymerase IV [Bacillota bacterium]